MGASLRGGPLDGAPTEPPRDLPVSLVAVLAPVLDEDAETLAWEPVSYAFTLHQKFPPPDGLWLYLAVRRLGERI